MKLTDLNPRWIDSSCGRRGVMVAFDCPCGKKEVDEDWDNHQCHIPLSNPLDGGPQFDTSGPMWVRAGEDFATLTLNPSINRPVSIGGCGWHGWIRDGEVITC